MTRVPLFTLDNTLAPDSAIDAWMGEHRGELGAIAQRWFSVMRRLGRDVCERPHDDQPTACVGAAAFAYVACHKAHVNVGFFRGAHLEDPAGILQGTGKNMRHVKLRPDGHANREPFDTGALTTLIEAAYADIRRCLAD